jgi:hypothetical protein
MITPSIHINGTSAETLTEQYQDAYRAVQEAITVIQFSAPNARDYKICKDPQGDFYTAVMEHRERLRMLDVVAQQLLGLAQYCSQHIRGRDRRI